MGLFLEETRAREASLIKDAKKLFAAPQDPVDAFMAIGRKYEAKAEQRKISSTNYRKHHGIYFTPYSIAKKLVDDLLDLGSGPSIDSTFLDPCSGNGVFVIAYIDAVVERLKISTIEDFQKLVNNIYYADIDSEIVQLLAIGVRQYIKQKYCVCVSMPVDNSFSGNSLYRITNDGILKNDLKEVFGITRGFSVVATNPPYRLLKATSKHYGDDLGNNHKLDTKKLVNFLRAGNYYPLNEGTINLYKLFCEEMITKLTSDSGLVGLLIPQTLLNDQQSSKLRNKVLSYNMSTIYIIPESSKFFAGITQAFCFFGIDKSSKSQGINIVPVVRTQNDFNSNPIKVNNQTLATISDAMSIVAEDKKSWEVLKKIHQFPLLKNIPQLRNLRGELDLTLNKSAITGKKTEWHLLRGANLKQFKFVPSREYVTREFALSNPKSKYIQHQRIACQQVANMNAKKRLKFCLIEPGFVLGNSCNFVALDEDSLWSRENLTLKYLLGLLNSSILEWRFRLTSSNNHVGNYELGNLPIPIPNKQELNKIEECVVLTLKDISVLNLDRLDMLVAKLYKLSPEELKYIKENTNKKIIQRGLL